MDARIIRRSLNHRIAHHEHLVIQIEQPVRGAEDDAAGADAREDHRVDLLAAQDELELVARAGVVARLREDGVVVGEGVEGGVELAWGGGDGGVAEAGDDRGEGGGGADFRPEEGLEVDAGEDRQRRGGLGVVRGRDEDRGTVDELGAFGGGGDGLDEPVD